MIKHKLKTLTLFLLLLVSCHSPSSTSSQWYFIAGRNEENSLHRPLLYHILAPSHWICQTPLKSESIVDTTKPNCTFYIQEGGQSIRITIHTFPFQSLQMRISPLAQITRWKKQFKELDPLWNKMAPISWGGFHGLYFEGQGLVQNEPIRVMGWSMQLASGYVHQLNLNKHLLDHWKQADYTIKASGPPILMEKHRLSILAFAQTFEFIDELPPPS